MAKSFGSPLTARWWTPAGDTDPDPVRALIEPLTGREMAKLKVEVGLAAAGLDKAEQAVLYYAALIKAAVKQIDNLADAKTGPITTGAAFADYCLRGGSADAADLLLELGIAVQQAVVLPPATGAVQPSSAPGGSAGTTPTDGPAAVVRWTRRPPKPKRGGPQT